MNIISKSNKLKLALRNIAKPNAIRTIMNI